MPNVCVYRRQYVNQNQYNMNFNNFTIKSQEALQAATQEAMNNGQQAIETGHVLKGVLNVDENVTPFLLKKFLLLHHLHQSLHLAEVKQKRMPLEQ